MRIALSSSIATWDCWRAGARLPQSYCLIILYSLLQLSAPILAAQKLDVRDLASAREVTIERFQASMFDLHESTVIAVSAFSERMHIVFHCLLLQLTRCLY